jgi:hypothetical protein
MDQAYNTINRFLSETRTFLSCVCGNILNGKCENTLSADNRVYSAHIMLDTYNALQEYNTSYNTNSTLNILFDDCCMLNRFIENYIDALPT